MELQVSINRGSDILGSYTRYDITSDAGDVIEATLRGAVLTVDWVETPQMIYYLSRVQTLAGPERINAVKGYVTAKFADLVKDPHYVARLARTVGARLGGSWGVELVPEGRKTWIVLKRASP